MSKLNIHTFHNVAYGYKPIVNLPPITTPPIPPRPKTMQEIQAMSNENTKQKRLESVESFRKSFNCLVAAFGDMDGHSVEALRRIRHAINELEDVTMFSKRIPLTRSQVANNVNQD